MLDARSALEGLKPVAAASIRIEERPFATLVQVAGFASGFATAARAQLGKLPRDIGQAQEADGRILFLTGPRQLWVVSNEPLTLTADKALTITPLSASRTRIEVEGPAARAILAKSIAVDFAHDAFRPGHFVMSGIHHTPVLVHCVGDDAFHVYAMRTFAQAVWEWLVDGSVEFTV
jgi:sarcosine oxidase subunit gamma